MPQDQSVACVWCIIFATWWWSAQITCITNPQMCFFYEVFS